MDKILKVEMRDQYGMRRYYPKNDVAEIFCTISRTKTLDPFILRQAETLGFNIEVTVPNVTATWQYVPGA